MPESERSIDHLWMMARRADRVDGTGRLDANVDRTALCCERLASSKGEA